jgi:hypothetical protein
MAAGMLALVGCDQGTPGGPGATRREPGVTRAPTASDRTPATAHPDNTPAAGRTGERTPVTGQPGEKPLIGNAKETFTLSVPTFSTSLKQGESKAVTIGVKRGTGFDEDVSMRFSDVPKGVSIEPANPTIGHQDKEVKVTLKAAPDAALGDYMIKVIGHPATGADATNELKITIKK